MTCIVGIETADGVVMGGDSMAGHAYDCDLLIAPKVIKRRSQGTEWIIGGCGILRDLQIAQHRVTLPRVPKDIGRLDRFMVTTAVDAFRKGLKAGGSLANDDGEESSDGIFLIGLRGRLYRMGFGFSVVRVLNNYLCTGSGQPVAYGVLFATPDLPATQRVEMALTAAAEHVGSVRPPFTILTGAAP